MEDEKLNKNGLAKVWLKFWTLLKVLVGDVDVTGKGDLQTQIDKIDIRVEECFRNASDGKKLIADAITGRGVATKVSDTFAIMAANIAKIAGAAKLQNKTAVLSNVEQTVKADAGYDGLGQVSVPAVKGTAGAGDVLSGKTFSGAVGVEKAGTMPNKGAWTGDTTDNGTVAIPAGYHNGQGYVSGAGAYAKGMEDADARTNVDSANYRTGYTAGVADTKVGTAMAADVLSGKTFTNSKDVGADGGMANRAAVTVDAGGVSQDDEYTYFTVPSDAFYNANSKLRTKNSNITPNLKICGIAQPGGAPVTVPKAGCYIVYMSAQSGREPAQPENTEIVCEPTYFSVATIGVYIAVYKSTDVTSVVCTGSSYNYVQGAIVLAP